MDKLQRIYSDVFLQSQFNKAGFHENDLIKFLPRKKAVKDAYFIGLNLIYQQREKLHPKYKTAIENRHASPDSLLPRLLVLMCLMEGAAHGYLSWKTRDEIPGFDRHSRPDDWRKLFERLEDNCDSLIKKIELIEGLGSHFHNDIPKEKTQAAIDVLKMLSAASRKTKEKYKGLINKTKDRHKEDKPFLWLIEALLFAWSDLLGQKISSAPNASHRPVCNFLAKAITEDLAKAMNDPNKVKSYDALRNTVNKIRKIKPA